MPENPTTNEQETDGQPASPASLADGQLAPDRGNNPQPPNRDHPPAKPDKPPSYKSLWREIRFIDLVNCLVGIAMLVVAISALRVARDTREVNSAVRHISDLASQTKRQADALQSQLQPLKDEAHAAQTQVQILSDQLKETKLQTSAFQTQATAAQGQLTVSREEQRAQLELVSPYISASTALKFMDIGTAVVLVQFHAKNIGHSLAEYAAAHGEFYPRIDSKVLERQEKACATKVPDENLTPGAPQGFTIGQGEETDIGMWLQMGRDNVVFWKDRYTKLGKNGVIPMIVGCIDYVYNGSHHHTPFVFEVDHRDASNQPWGYGPINPNAGDVAAGDLVFPIPPWFAGKSD